VDWKLELIVVPVSDIDRAKAFYIEKTGFELLVDVSGADDFRVVQLNPPGSACAIALMRDTEGRAGSLKGLHLIVHDIDGARAELIGRGAVVSDVFHFDDGRQRPGPDALRASYNSFFSFEDPDGNTWLVQEVHREEPV
jgi:catechol 2,3-dioxygenase-like lactoylglutathione lyase family enzyme